MFGLIDLVIYVNSDLDLPLTNVSGPLSGIGPFQSLAKIQAH